MSGQVSHNNQRQGRYERLHTVLKDVVLLKKKKEKEMKNTQHYKISSSKTGAIFLDTYDKSNLQCIASLIQDLIRGVSA